MPSGRVHAAMASPITVGLALAGLGLAFLHPPALALGAGAWLGEHLTPDIDHPMFTLEEQRVARWNPILGAAWWLYWTPYQKAHPHRGTSHTWPQGTVERFLIACWPLLLASLGVIIYTDGEWLFPIAWAWAYVFAGQSVQDIVHIAADTMSTRIRRTTKRR